MSIKVVDAKIIRVSTMLYRAIRSFAESSLKTNYLWNTGIHLMDKVIFEKAGKWRLSVENSLEALLEAPNSSSCIKYNYNSAIIEVMDATSFLRIDARKDPLELERTFLVPDKDIIPFARPLRLSEIVAKMELYLMAAKSHFDECVRKEEAEVK